MATAIKLPEDSILTDEYQFSPKELAEKWNWSTDTIIRMFENESGVQFANTGTTSKRPKRSMRIPASVAARVKLRDTVQ